MNVFELFAKLSLDTSEYDEGLDDAEKSASGFGSKLSKGLGTAGKVAGGAMLAVGTASVALGKSFVDNMGNVASFGDNIDKMSQKIGISAEAYQEWDFIAQHSGTSMESLKASFKTLSTAAQSGAEEFEALGISLEDAASMSTEDLFASVISGLQNMEEGTERTALASKLLGRGATELGALLNTSAEDTEAMRQQLHDLGGVMSDEAVKSAAQYQDSLQNMQTAMTGLKNNMVSDFLPATSMVMDGLAKIFSGDMTGLDNIDLGIDELITNLTNNLPKIMQVGVKIIESLGKAIITNLPKILPTVISLITSLGQMLIDNLPLLLETGLELFTTLITTLAEDLPDILITLIDTIVNMIPTLIDAIVGALPDIINGMITLILGIVEALPTIIQSLIDALPTIITSIINALMTAIPQLVQGAITLVIELVKHLPEIIMALIQAIPQIIMAIIEAFAPLVTSLGEKAGEAISNMVDWFKQLPEKLAFWAGQTVAKIVSFFIELPTKVKEWFNKTKDNATEFFKNLIDQAKEKGKQFVDDLIAAIKGLPDKIKDIGRNIVDGLKNGIKEKWDAMVQWFNDLGADFIAGFKSVFGIASPSKVFAQIGGYMAEGLQVGWDDQFANFEKELDNIDLNMNVDANASGTTNINNTDAEIADLLRAILNRMPNGINPNSIFRLMREQNEEFRESTGVSAFA